MPSNATLVSPDASCWLCSYAKRIGRSACVACQSASRPTKHLPKPVNTKPQYHRRHVRASALYELAEASSRNEGAPHITLDSLLKTVQSEKMVPMETDAPGVMLAHGDFGKVPAIWLEPADGSAPTMDLITWTTLETPIWEGDEVYVCLEKDSVSAHGRRKSCKACVVGVWMDAGARLMLGGFTEDERGEGGWQSDCEWEWQEEEKDESRARRAFRRFRKPFQRQKPRPVSVWD